MPEIDLIDDKDGKSSAGATPSDINEGTWVALQEKIRRAPGMESVAGMSGSGHANFFNQLTRRPL